MGSSLILAVRNGDVNAARQIITSTHCRDLDLQGPRKDGSALAHMLILRGADMEAVTSYGATPLHAAVDHNQVETTRMASPLVKEESMEYQNVHAPTQESGASGAHTSSRGTWTNGQKFSGTIITDEYLGTSQPPMVRVGLTDIERKEADRAVKEAEEAVRHAKATVKQINSMKSDPDGIASFQGLGKVTTFNECKNVHIGNTNFITNYSSAGPWRATPRTQPPDPEVQSLTNEQREVTQQEVHTLAENIGSQWRRLGRNLGLEDAKLDGFHFDFHLDGLYEICYQMIRFWKASNGPNASVKSVVKALISMDKSDIARKVFLTPS